MEPPACHRCLICWNPILPATAIVRDGVNPGSTKFGRTLVCTVDRITVNNVFDELSTCCVDLQLTSWVLLTTVRLILPSAPNSDNMREDNQSAQL